MGLFNRRHERPPPKAGSKSYRYDVTLPVVAYVVAEDQEQADSLLIKAFEGATMRLGHPTDGINIVPNGTGKFIKMGCL